MNQVIEIGVDESGRMLIPAALRERLNLSPGMTLVVEQSEEDELRLIPQLERPVLVLEDGILVADVETLVDVGDIVRRERDQRVLDLIERAGL